MGYYFLRFTLSDDDEEVDEEEEDVDETEDLRSELALCSAVVSTDDFSPCENMVSVSVVILTTKCNKRLG